MCTNPLDLVWFLICWCIVCFLYHKVKVTESCAGDVYGILMRRSATHHLLGLLSKKPQHSLQINYLAIIYWSLLKTTPSPTSVLSGSVVNICSKHHWHIWLEREVVYCDKVLNLTCGMHSLTIHHLWWRRKSKDDDWFTLRCNPATPTSPPRHTSHVPPRQYVYPPGHEDKALPQERVPWRNWACGSGQGLKGWRRERKSWEMATGELA